jgi:TATA-box binding protein (TBP) (component of TFIID and TFIIIB)
MDSLIEDQEKINSKLHISTISTTCKIGHTIINIENIYNYLPVSKENILLINYKNTFKTIDDSLIKKRKKKTKKIEKKINNFFNQITLLIAVDEKKKINTKLFTNGSVQMTGSKSILDNINILNKLIGCLKTTFNIDGQEIKLVENPELLQVSDFKISMINTNFGIGNEINREEILKIIKKEDLYNIKAKLKPDIHAAVNIELFVSDSIVTILVFKTGNIIITGGKNSTHINTAYNFINKIINDNKSKIIKNFILNDQLSDL